MTLRFLVFSGRIRSGKTTLSEAVSAALNIRKASFGDFVRKAAAERGLQGTREQLQEIGESFVQADADGFCEAVLRSAGWQPDEPMVVDGLRHELVLDKLKRLASPGIVRLVVVTTDDATREERQLRLGGVTPIAQIDQHASEQDVKERLPKLADLLINGERPVHELTEATIGWLRRSGELPSSSRTEPLDTRPAVGRWSPPCPPR